MLTFLNSLPGSPALWAGSFTSQIQPRGAFDAMLYITNPQGGDKYFLTSFFPAATNTAKIKRKEVDDETDV
jgi:hypothetical protein